MKTSHQINLHKNQTGLVSIMVTMIMMLVITLIVLGFAQVTRRNQREAIDKQVSTQAYYAAETGVNDAVNYLVKMANAGTEYTGVGTGVDQTKCSGLSSFSTYAALTSTIDTTTNTGYTCLLVNPNPTSLQAPIALGGNSVWHIADKNNSVIGNLTFSFAKDVTAAAAPCNTSDGTNAFTPATGAGSWSCDFPVLRIDLVDTAATRLSGNALDLTNNTKTIYIVPTTLSTAVTVNPIILSMGGSYVIYCKAVESTGCSQNIKLHPIHSKSFYARVSTLYRGTSLAKITGLSFAGGDVVIDSTGKAQDQLSRIQVRVPIGTGYNNGIIPMNALESTGGICKYFIVAPGGSAAQIDPSLSGCTYPTN